MPNIGKTTRRGLQKELEQNKPSIYTGSNIPARVTIDKSVTYHAGDNNYIKVGIKVESSVDASEDEMVLISKTTERLTNFVDEEINRQLEEQLEEFNN